MLMKKVGEKCMLVNNFQKILRQHTFFPQHHYSRVETSICSRKNNSGEQVFRKITPIVHCCKPFKCCVDLRISQLKNILSDSEFKGFFLLIRVRTSEIFVRGKPHLYWLLFAETSISFAANHRSVQNVRPIRKSRPSSICDVKYSSCFLKFSFA